jgi:sirohydrochlorin ferrochelatase
MWNAFVIIVTVFVALDMLLEAYKRRVNRRMWRERLDYLNAEWDAYEPTADALADRLYEAHLDEGARERGL